jgi:hypothetical protein
MPAYLVNVGMVYFGQKPNLHYQQAKLNAQRYYNQLCSKSQYFRNQRKAGTELK